MTVVEIGILLFGLSLDVAAVVMCDGATLEKIEKEKVFSICGIFCLWQFAAIMAGNLVSYMLVFWHTGDSVQKVWNQIAGMIFAGIGSCMVYKAWQRRQILERRSDIEFRKICKEALITSGQAFFAGIGLGLLDTRMNIVAGILEGVTVFAVIMGIYIGYRFGYEQKTKAYLVGGAMLLIEGICIWFRTMQ